ncbi:MAG: hypothetical protein AAF202_00385 [Pseudomonadota bacterium]
MHRWLFAKAKIVLGLAAIVMGFHSQAGASLCRVATENLQWANSPQTLPVMRVGPGLRMKQNPYLHPINRHQRAYLEALGARFTKRAVQLPARVEMAVHHNQMVKDLIDKGDLLPEDALYWSEVFVLNNELLFLALGIDEIPEAAQLFEVRRYWIYRGRYYTKREVEQLTSGVGGVDRNMIQPAKAFFEDGVYGDSMADNRIPILLDPKATFHSNFNGNKGYSYFATVLHDLAHPGGAVDEPALMALYVRVAKYNRKRNGPNQIRNFATVNEDAYIFDQERVQTIVKALRNAVSNEASMFETRSHNETRQKFSGLDEETTLKLVDQFLEEYPLARKALGGLARTGEAALTRSNQRPLDRIHFDMMLLKQDLNWSLGAVPAQRKFRRFFLGSRRADADSIIGHMQFYLYEALLELENLKAFTFLDYLRVTYPEMYALVKDDYDK